MSAGAGGLDVIRQERIKGRIEEFLRNYEKKRKRGIRKIKSVVIKQRSSRPWLPLKK